MKLTGVVVSKWFANGKNMICRISALKRLKPMRPYFAMCNDIVPDVSSNVQTERNLQVYSREMYCIFYLVPCHYKFEDRVRERGRREMNETKHNGNKTLKKKKNIIPKFLCLSIHTSHKHPGLFLDQTVFLTFL